MSINIHMRTTLSLYAAALLIVSLVYVAHLRSGEVLRERIAQAAPKDGSLPRNILWVWERPEDLHAIDPATTAVAVLQETLLLGSSVTSVTRHQPVLLPEHVSQIAVVRIETVQDFAAHSDDAPLLRNVVANLDRISRQPGVAALQIDFDAKKSERPFYRRLLRELRKQVPAELPLDITALVSWCSTDDWISDLPINSATPMFFRMEPDRRRLALSATSRYQLHEPLCSGSVGVSTTEPWPQNIAGKRTFIFADRGWATDLAMLRTLYLTYSETVPDYP